MLRRNNRGRMFGKFAPGSLNTLIGPDECAEATKRFYRPEDYGHAARVPGVDVARFGADASVIFPCQGLVASASQKFCNFDGLQGAGAVARKLADWQADAVFIDDTGGWGASWIDNLRRLGHAPIGVGLASRPNDARFDNTRTEMNFAAVEWIKQGGALPPITTPGCPELIAALSRTDLLLPRRPPATRTQGPGEAAAGLQPRRRRRLRAHLRPAGGEDARAVA